MNDFDTQRKEFMNYHRFHPMVQRGTNQIKDKMEYEVILKEKENAEEKTEVLQVVVSNNNDEEENQEEKEDMSLLKRAKKTAAAVSGGALVVVGIPLIPIPIPCGCIMVAGGLSILASEFPAAQRVIDQGKEKIRDFAEHEEEEVETEKDEIGLDFEMLNNNDDNGETNIRTKCIEKNLDGGTIVHKIKRNGPKESLRQLTKNRILPLIDRPSSAKGCKETDDDVVIVQVEEKN